MTASKKSVNRSVDAAVLTGTWFLADAYAIDADGARLYDLYGAKPSGVIVYGADGRMVALITHDGRERLDGDRQAAPEKQRAQAFTTSISYSGSYSVRSNEVVHHVDLSTYPNWVGVDLLRFMEVVDGDVVLTTPPQMQNGVETVLRLRWQRDKPDWYQ